MMEPFLLYVIICTGALGTCVDIGSRTSWIFRNYEDCNIFAGKMLNAYRERIEAEGKIFIDGKAFCLRFTETKGA